MSAARQLAIKLSGTATHNTLMNMTKGIVRGFTLVELMVTISVVAVLASIAIPSFDSFLVGSQRRGAVQDFISSAALTRSEAIKRGAPVMMQAKATGSPGFQAGWLMFVDEASTGVAPATGSTLIIQDQGAYAIGQVEIGCGLALDSASTPQYLRFDASGKLIKMNGASGADSLGVKILRSTTVKSTALLVFDWGGRSKAVENQLPATGC